MQTVVALLEGLRQREELADETVLAVRVRHHPSGEIATGHRVSPIAEPLVAPLTGLVVKGDVETLSFGEMMRAEGHGEARLAMVRDAMRKHEARIMGVGVDPRTLRWLGGLSFFPRAGSDAPAPDATSTTSSGDRLWASVAEAAFTLPRWSWSRDGAESHVTWLVRAHELREPARLEAEARAQLARIEHDVATLRGGADEGAWSLDRSGLTDCSDDREAYERLVASALGSLARRELTKVVVARSVRYPMSERLSPLALLARLATIGATRFAFRLGSTDAPTWFVGATPELLLAMQGGEIVTEAVAGSHAIEAGNIERATSALCASDKDLREHAAVVAGISSSLAGLTTSVRIADGPTVRRIGNLLHLVTPVRATPRPNTDVFDLVERLHPTPALCGSPVQAAARFIREHEGFDRGWYGAPVGWATLGGDAELHVGIRSALLAHESAILFAGAGIVAGSSPAAEFEETEAKLSPMRRALEGRG